ncbi:MAG: HDIG domain-containing protein [Deltaproteobacteria bacterium]|nr:HDIG domain-containing protein [Deltaproteobacteria bacterium]
MNRDEALQLVRSRLGDSATTKHSLAAEACMRKLAQRFGEDVELWGLAGLVHDLDLDVCQNDLERHTVVGAEVLAAAGAPKAVIQAVLGHNDKATRVTRMDKALWVVDPTTGFITASALIRPSKSTCDLEADSVKKRMKDKRFSAAINRDQIKACKELLGLELDDYLALCIQAMNEIRVELGLAGAGAEHCP